MKVLGWIIGALFVAGLLLGPALGLYLVSKDAISALSYEGSQQVSIDDCKSVRVSGQGGKYLRVPVVKLASGQTVSGSVDEIRFIWECDDHIGESVEVRYNIDNPNKAKLNTFLEMWFLPVLLGLACIIWYPLIVIGYLKKYRNQN